MAIEFMSGVAGVRAQSVSSPSGAPSSEAEVSALRERAAAFWAARIAGDAETQWQLLEPRGRGRMTAQEYATPPTGGRFLAYQIDGAVIKGLFGTVKVRVLIQQILSTPGPSQPPSTPRAVIVDDNWVRISGTWYREMDDSAKTQGKGREP